MIADDHAWHPDCGCEDCEDMTESIRRYRRNHGLDPGDLGFATVEDDRLAGEVSVYWLIAHDLWVCRYCNYHADGWEPEFGDMCPGCLFRIAKKIRIHERLTEDADTSAGPPSR